MIVQVKMFTRHFVLTILFVENEVPCEPNEIWPTKGKGQGLTLIQNKENQYS
jgi:hypothetical protein